MKPTEAPADVDPQARADFEEVCRLVAEGKRVTDPELLQRVEERAEEAREAMAGTELPKDFSVRLIRESRGEADPRELTLDQCDILRRDGQLRPSDPETGVEYALVPADEYERLRG